MTSTSQTPFENDSLGRQRYADSLCRLVIQIAEASASSLPGSRVLAVDAPWGSGKTWIAQQLPGYFVQDRGIGRCVYINAFEFDYHHDPFVVLASAVIDASKDAGTDRTNLKSAAAAVVKSLLPVAGKAALRVGSKALGLDGSDLAEVAAEAIGDGSEAAIERLLSTYTSSQKSVRAFREQLEKLAKASSGPLVVIIDELDRCRPSFALETLERVKHLFDVPGVVFLLFIHSDALHSAIRQTYGDGIDPAAYLRKFISMSLGMPRTKSSRPDLSDEIELLTSFVHATSPTQGQNVRALEMLKESACRLAPAFGSNLRDVQTVILFGTTLHASQSLGWPHEIAYALLLRCTDKDQASRLSVVETQSAAFKAEADRLAPLAEIDGLASELRMAFLQKSSGQQSAVDVNRQREQEKMVVRLLDALQSDLAYLRR
jgi:hypothetical protein